MRLIVAIFSAAFGGAFVGVVASRAVSAFVVRRAFLAMQRRAMANVVAGGDGPPESDCA